MSVTESIWAMVNLTLSALAVIWLPMPKSRSKRRTNGQISCCLPMLHF